MSKPKKVVKPTQKKLAILFTRANTWENSKKKEEIDTPKGKRAIASTKEDEHKKRPRRKYVPIAKSNEEMK